MANITQRFFRLNYSNDAVLEAMVESGNVICNDQDLALSIRIGDAILLARFDERNQAGEIRAIGMVRNVPGGNCSSLVDWVRVNQTVHPSAQGMRFWRQAKPFFVFAESVVGRYGLRELCHKYFGKSMPTSSSVVAVSPPVSARALKSNATGKEPQSARFRGVVDPSSENPRGGYVYLISSPHGYKIGKTKRMKERSQLFSVKLPFEITVIHYAWFDDYSRAESVLHRRFQSKRLGGEWFNLNSFDVEVVKRFTL